jgi:hypothetical protein
MPPKSLNDEARAKKEWHPPALRKLPIAATAQGKAGGNTNDGSGGGKGEVVTPLS